MVNSDYQTCSFCVMDTGIQSVILNSEGQCNCCLDAISRKSTEWWPNDKGKARLNDLLAKLKKEGEGKSYDAMIGLSGGIDSAYLAHLAVRVWGLRVLAVHVDGGWNSEAATSNIERLVRILDLDLYTYVVEWSEMRDVQMSFLKASVLNQDMPQDHAFFAILYRTAIQFGLRSFLSGVNFSSESITIPDFGYPAIDGYHLKSVHKKFGVLKLKSYPIMNFREYIWITRFKKQLSIYKPLDFILYDKKNAIDELRSFYGWKDYGPKHSESRFTKFYQDIFLPEKFGFDKRKLHLSSLILSGQLDRDKAIIELSKPIITEREKRREIKFIAKKLGITESALLNFIRMSPVNHLDYPNSKNLHSKLLNLRRIFRMISSVFNGFFGHK
jgi:N-acetyl sugar amidotransferase